MSYARTLPAYTTHQWQNPKGYNILLEGDSWADIPVFTSNLGWSLALALKDKINLCNISHSGDLMDELIQGPQWRRLKKAIGNRNYKFDLLIISAGGNDILLKKVDGQTNIERLLKTANGDDPNAYINHTVCNEIMQLLVDQYRIVLDYCQSANPELKVATHCYDFIYPRNKATLAVIVKVAGPWVWPAMNKKGITEPAMQRKIMKVLLGEFRTRMLTLTQQYANFHLFDTQGVLPELSQWQDDIENWHDEIHPNSDGFRVLVEQCLKPQIENWIAQQD